MEIENALSLYDVMCFKDNFWDVYFSIKKTTDLCYALKYSSVVTREKYFRCVKQILLRTIVHENVSSLACLTA